MTESSSSSVWSTVAAPWNNVKNYINELNTNMETYRSKINEDSLQQASNIMLDTVQNKAKQAIGQIQHIALAGRSPKDQEIAVHYIREKKYGLEGSDGTFKSNYYRYTLNYHPLLSICFASKKNPFSRARRFLIWLNKISLALLLAAIIADTTTSSYRARFQARAYVSIIFIISVIIGAYGYILEKIAVCYLCNHYNICVKPIQGLSLCVLLALAIPSIVMFVLGVYVLYENQSDRSFIGSFIGSIVLDYLSFFYIGIINWILVSWKGCLCIPIFPPSVFCCCIGLFCCGHNPCPGGFPPRFCPLLGLFPISMLLKIVNLGQDTYIENKLEFQKDHPRRKAIDDDDGDNNIQDNV